MKNKSNTFSSIKEFEREFYPSNTIKKHSEKTNNLDIEGTGLALKSIEHIQEELED